MTRCCRNGSFDGDADAAYLLFNRAKARIVLNGKFSFNPDIFLSSGIKPKKRHCPIPKQVYEHFADYRHGGNFSAVSLEDKRYRHNARPLFVILFAVLTLIEVQRMKLTLEKGIPEASFGNFYFTTIANMYVNFLGTLIFFDLDKIIYKLIVSDKDGDFEQ